MKKLIVLWAHPRSRSTAFERMMIERGDFLVLHEPFCTLYDVGEFTIDVEGEKHTFDKNEELLQWVLNVCEERNVFIKETCEYDYEDVFFHDQFIQRAQHAFIVRDLKETIASHYEMNSKVTAKEIGLEQLLKIKKILLSAQIPFFKINAEQLVQTPTNVIQQFCVFMEIPFLSRALFWEKGDIDLWNRTKKWHEAASKTNGFVQRESTYARTVDNDIYLESLYNYNIKILEQL